MEVSRTCPVCEQSITTSKCIKCGYDFTIDFYQCDTFFMCESEDYNKLVEYTEKVRSLYIKEIEQKMEAISKKLQEEEERRRKLEELEKRKKALEEELAQAEAEEARKRFWAEVDRKRAEAEAAKKKAEAEAVRKWEEEEAAKKRAEAEAARKKAEAEEAKKRAEAVRKLAEEEEAKKRAEAEAAKKKAEAEVAKKMAEEEEVRKKAEVRQIVYYNTIVPKECTIKASLSQLQKGCVKSLYFQNQVVDVTIPPNTAINQPLLIQSIDGRYNPQVIILKPGKMAEILYWFFTVFLSFVLMAEGLTMSTVGLPEFFALIFFISSIVGRRRTLAEYKRKANATHVYVKRRLAVAQKK